MTIRCPDCGHEEPDGERFCGQCGRGLIEMTGAWEEWGLPVSGEEYYYSYEWFGEMHRIRKWKWDLGIVYMVGMGVVIALFFLGIGWWVNALLFVLTMCLAAYLQYVIGKRKYGIAALFAVAFLVILPGMLIASFPWQEWHEDYLEDKYAPKFSASITSQIVNGTNVVCDGNVTNYGRTGSQAIVKFKAYSGPSDDLMEQWPDIETGTVTTEWIAPDGGTAHVHWECNLDYFNWGGSVTWTLEPYD